VIVVYDGVCNLCNGWLRFVSAREPRGAVRFTSIQSPAGELLLARHGYRVEALDTLLVIDEGALYVKTDAIARVLSRLGHGWRLMGWILRKVHRPTRDWLYTRIALNRYRLFGRSAACAIPPPNASARVIWNVADLPPHPE
jgi:predicted DCC family thiol-disulfide oxidoreductase YuxK